MTSENTETARFGCVEGCDMHVSRQAHDAELAEETDGWLSDVMGANLAYIATHPEPEARRG